MAPRRLTLGWLVGAMAVMAFAVAGCGGGSSSASATAESSSSGTRAEAGAPQKAGGGGSGDNPTMSKNGEASDAPPIDLSAADEGNHRRNKHPPIELPTGEPEKAPPKNQRPHVPTASMELSLPRGLTVANTCDGKNVSPELSWTEVPPGTVELAVFAVNLQPVDGDLHFDWAMAGIDPDLDGLKQGQVPKGAVIGENGDGHSVYSLCPEASAAETYLFSVYALTEKLSPKHGFDPLAFREQATRVSDQNGITGVTYAAG